MDLLPIVMTLIATMSSDVIFLESKWWVIAEVAVAYLITNYVVSVAKNVTEVYYLDWSISYEISPFSPVFGSLGLTLIAIAAHFAMGIVTQLMRKRYEADFA
mmetsp:Transcript_17848/g.30287  ORF Transcript_17848/g.30287 Transcript_17848/m.30287 type:complete len:102 (+) Transcript_17848:625-930(+)